MASCSPPLVIFPPSSPPIKLQTRIRTRPETQLSWVETLRSQARDEDFSSALQTFIAMCDDGFSPDHFAFPAALKAASVLRNLSMGKQLHASLVKFGYHVSPVTVSNTLVTMYSRCGQLGCALRVFDKMPHRDQVSWNSLIAALCLYDMWVPALDALRTMLTDCPEICSFTLVSIILACSNLPELPGLKLGKSTHAYALKHGLLCKDFVYNALISMYAKLGRIEKSISLFALFKNRDLVSWNSIISSLVQNDQFSLAIQTFRELIHLTYLKPDGVTMSSVLPAISKLDLLNTGREIHAYLIKNDDLIENPFVASALVDLYCNMGRVETGRLMFDLVKHQKHFRGLYNSMISGYAQNGFDKEAINLFIKMSLTGLNPNETTIASVLPSFAKYDLFKRKESIHGYVIKRGMENDIFVQNAIMDMYARLGKMDVSRRIFESLESKDLVSWNTLISGHIISGTVFKAFEIMSEMQINNMKPNIVTLITVLPLCGTHAILNKGKEIHGFAIRRNFHADVALGSALVDMYAKCGWLTTCQKVFDEMPERNIVTWNVLIMAYGMHGQGDKALNAFNALTLTKEVKPDDVTFISVLVACSHCGLVHHGLSLFKEMKSKYFLNPTPDHYACIVDLLGRAGRLNEAYSLIRTLTSGPHLIGAWSSLLGACRVHKNVKLASVAARRLFELEPNESSHYVLLSNIYSDLGQYENASEVRIAMKLNNVKKIPGCSWIEINNRIHKFLAGDSLHPESSRIHNFLGVLWERIKKEGFKPDLSCVMHDVDEREKERILSVHSEKLAIVYGLISLPKENVIRVTKNLRVCNDCHEMAKFVSEMERREIVLRDVKRFHHFRDGVCSCGDYW